MYLRMSLEDCSYSKISRLKPSLKKKRPRGNGRLGV